MFDGVVHQAGQQPRAAQLQSRDTDSLNWSDFRLCDEKSRTWVASVFFGNQIYASGVGERRSVCEAVQAVF